MQEEETATEEDHGGYEQQQDQHVLSDDAGRLEESVLPNRRDGRIDTCPEGDRRREHRETRDANGVGERLSEYVHMATLCGAARAGLAARHAAVQRSFEPTATRRGVSGRLLARLLSITLLLMKRVPATSRHIRSLSRRRGKLQGFEPASGIGELGSSELGSSELGRLELGRLVLGRLVLGRLVLGRLVLGRLVLGR